MFSSPQRFPACLGSFPQLDSEALWTKTTKAQEVASSLSSPLSLLPSNRHSFWGFSSRKNASFFGHWPETSLPRLRASCKGGTLTHRYGELSYNSRTVSALYELLCTCWSTVNTAPLWRKAAPLCLLGTGCHWLPWLCTCGRVTGALLQLTSHRSPAGLSHYTVSVSEREHWPFLLCSAWPRSVSKLARSKGHLA